MVLEWHDKGGISPTDHDKAEQEVRQGDEAIGGEFTFHFISDRNADVLSHVIASNACKRCYDVPLSGSPKSPAQVGSGRTVHGQASSATSLLLAGDR